LYAEREPLIREAARGCCDVSSDSRGSG
jgi:hypothetical protein